MTITSEDGYVTALLASQKVTWSRLTTRTSVATTPFSLIDIAGQPGAGVLAGTSVAVGVVPTDATAGCPLINAFGGGAKGFIHSVGFGNSVASRIRLYDMLFKAGAYAFNASQALATQPSYAGRVPNGTDFTGTQIWVECVTAFTGNPSIAVTYTDDAGATGHTTGTVAFGLAPTIGRMTQLPLAAGDDGVSVIESVTATVASVGTFNVLVLRKLWEGRVNVANAGDVHGPKQTGKPEVFADSALFATVMADSTSTGIPELFITIANG